MARKKEDRDGKNRRLPLKSKKTARDNKEADADIIKSQLFMLGLTLREVPGDGNCLFRALGDQLDGHMGNHCRHRQDTTNYMLEHIDDFQPFVEDDIPFDKHIGQLSQPGTYAGNDAIVAFARLHQITIVIHQPNAPLWQIRGWETEGESNQSKITKGKHIHSKKISHQLHIAYHGGDHYDSVRRLGDTSHVPANIVIDVDGGNDVGRSHNFQNKGNEDEYESCESHGLIDSARANEIEREAMQRSGCQDLPIVRQLLFNNCGNIDAAVDELLALSLKSTASEEERVTGVSHTSFTGGRSKTSFNRKKLERIRKQERKQANEVRRKSINPSETRSRETSEDTVIVGKLQCLNI